MTKWPLTSRSTDVFLIHRGRRASHRFRMEVLADGFAALDAHRLTQCRIIEEATQPVGEIRRVVWLHQHAGPRSLNQLHEGTVPWLHHRYAVGPGFEDVQALGLPERRRHGQHVETLQ